MSNSKGKVKYSIECATIKIIFSKDIVIHKN